MGRIKCPRCRSTAVQAIGRERKPFSIGKAVIGGVITAPLWGFGALTGFAGKNGKIEWYCIECGKRFKHK